LVTLYHLQGKGTQVELSYKRALEIAEKTLGKDHPSTKTFRENYELMKKEMAESAEKAVK